MRVRDIMTPADDVVTIDSGETLALAAERLTRNDIGALPVVDHAGVPVGLLSEGDVVRAVHYHPERPTTLPVQTIMRRPVPRCAPDDPISDVTARMTRERLRHLVVCDGGHVAGIISVGDILKHRLHELELEAGVLRDWVAAHRSRV